jgi:hypothetical protein
LFVTLQAVAASEAWVLGGLLLVVFHGSVRVLRDLGSCNAIEGAAVSQRGSTMIIAFVFDSWMDARVVVEARAKIWLSCLHLGEVGRLPQGMELTA